MAHPPTPGLGEVTGAARAAARRRWAVGLVALLALAPSPGVAQAPAGPRRTLDILEFQVVGAAALGAAELEGALEPFLGPGRALEDVEGARAALERLYGSKGYQSVSVAVPAQTVRDGVVRLAVSEGRVGRLRVRGARWHSPWEVRRLAPSVAEGTLPEFNALVADVVRLNQLPDRRVTPAIRAGARPGTVDVDLMVEDTLPLHATAEFNNRASAGTTPSRVNASLRYDNLWQAGHSLALAAQVAPQRADDGQVYSASYTARFADTPWLTLSASGVFQDSDISTLGAVAVRGRGRIFGGRASMTLPGSAGGFFHSALLGLDAKQFQERITLGSGPLENPITYWPFTAQYGAAWSGEEAQTSLALTALVNLRGAGSPERRFDDKRYGASGGFATARLELTRTQEAWAGFQAWARLGGQLASGPLLSPEQLVAGGADSVRGYLEGAAAGDHGVTGSLELRSPVLSGWAPAWALADWRLHAFADGAWLGIQRGLPEQQAEFLPACAGAGTRLRLFRRTSASFDVAVPLATVGATQRDHVRFHLRVLTEL